MTTGDEDDTLTHFKHQARAHSEAIFAARAPDFAAMMARARELAPDVVSAAAAAQAEALAPVIPIQRGHDRTADDAVLAPFTAAARAVLAAQPGVPRRPPPLLRSGRRVAGWTVGLVALAAALLLWQAPQRMAERLAGPATAVEALAGSRSDGMQPATLTPPRRTLAPPPDVDDAPANPSRPEPTIEPTVKPTDAPVALVTPTPPADPPRTPRRSAPTPTVPTISLEDDAQTLWQRGELAAAEQKFRAVVRVAGRSPRAELAYGDLFALAGQIRGADGQVALAREYLAAFPAGRFADDMRAGLCQRAAADARLTCWRDYLERHPAGAHRRPAETALAAGEVSP